MSNNKSHKVLIVHERYASPGGEDAAVATDLELLRAKGHIVTSWFEENAPLAVRSRFELAPLAWRTTWSRSSYDHMRHLIREERPDLVHFHNTLPLISPSAIHAARDAGAAVVLTLHNYRLLCPAGTFLRKGAICEDCVSKSLLQSVIHGCYRGSRVQTGAVALMLAVHRRAGTWAGKVDAYIALTGFMREKMIEGGLPGPRIHVRPNTTVLERLPSNAGGNPYALFLGRLSPEKGLICLLEASRMLDGVRIRIAGAGPMEEIVRRAASASGGSIEFLGHLDRASATRVLADATLLLFPSTWYEGFPMTIAEAFAQGVPVAASRVGAIPGIVRDGIEGILFEPGDPAALAGGVRRITNDAQLRERMSRAARTAYETTYSMERSYARLRSIYEAALESSGARRAAA